MAEGYGGGAYRLTPPQVKAYDPSNVEAFYAQRIGTPGTAYGSVAPYMQQARLDRLDAAEDYNANLAAVNAQQYDLGLRRMAADREKEMIGLNKTALEHPNQAATFAYSSQLIRPGAAQHASNLAVAGLDKTRSEAFENYGQGANFFDMAGVRPPEGATYLPSGAPTSPMTQGESRDIRKERVQGAYSLAAARSKSSGELGMKPIDIDRMTDTQNRIEEYRVKLIEDGEKSLLASMQETRDPAGNVTAGVKLSADQIAEARRRIRENADARARLQYDQLQRNYSLGGHSRFFAGNPYAPPTQSAPGGVNTPTERPGAPPLVVGGQTGDQRAATPTPPQAGPGAARPGLNGGSELEPSALKLRTHLSNNNVPNAERIASTALAEKRRLGGDGYRPAADGSVHILKKGQIIATVPAR